MRSLIIYILAAGVLLANSLSSQYLVGYDVHIEYYYAVQAIDSWNTSLPHSYNAGITVALAPDIARILHIGVIDVFRVVYPLLFAFVPVLMFMTYRRHIGESGAYIASVFFIVSPVFMVEMLGLPRQMIAEVWLCGLVLIAMTRPIQALMPLMLIGLVVSHYPTLIFGGVLMVGFLGYYAVKRQKAEVIGILGALLMAIGLAWFYYTYVADGWVLKHLSNMVTGMPLGTEAAGAPVMPKVGVERNPAMDFALGLDFFKVDAASRLFRLMQYASQLFILVGSYVILRSKKYDGRFKLTTVYGLVFLLVAMLVPSFGNAFNLTRAYHLSLILLAPAFYVGASALWLKIRPYLGKWRYSIQRYGLAVFLCFLFVFTSGFTYSLADYPTDKVSVPVTYAYSNQERDFGGYFTDDDDAMAQYIYDSGITPVYSDVTGVLILQHYMTMWETWPLPIAEDDFIGDGVYYFQRSWVTDQGTVPYWVGPGLRRYVDNWVEGDIIHEIGNAKLVKVR